jgi:putative phosphoesterase
MAVRRAVALFDQLGVDHVIHCGDVGGARVFDELVGRPCTFVWGNMDFAGAGQVAYLRTVGIPVPGEAPLILDLGGRRWAVFHGHEHGFQEAPGTLDVDFIVHGHTHTPRDEVRNGTRIINPGALHRTRRKTVATLDTTTDEVKFHEIR